MGKPVRPTPRRRAPLKQARSRREVTRHNPPEEKKTAPLPETVKPGLPKERSPKERLSGFWLYGIHAARATLANPRRKIYRAVLSERALADIGAAALRHIPFDTATPDVIGKLVPQGAVHQGVALLAEPLPLRDLVSALTHAGKPRVVAVLDQITDPHNEGAILRSAAAFGIDAVVVQDRRAAPESGVLAKAASGALDMVPRIAAVNIARTLEDLGRIGFWRVALAGDGEAPVAEAGNGGDIVFVLGAEGSGLRRLVRERCDVAAFIPMEEAMGSLNVSNAAAIAFYEIRRKTKL